MDAKSCELLISVVDKHKLGKTLLKTLRQFHHGEQLTIDDFIRKERIDGEIVQQRLFALARRGYIEKTQGECRTLADIGAGDFFFLTVEGLDYLELHQTWWRQMMEDRAFKLVPILVSFGSLVVSVLSFLQSLHRIDISGCLP